MFRSLNDFKKYIFPDKCVDCGNYPDLLCEKCISKFDISPQICHVCKTPSVGFVTHSNCQKKTSINQAFICFKYSKTIEKCVITLKFKFIEEMGGIIAKLMNDSGNIPELTNYILVPIPLHRKRENMRGFNQSELIAKEIVKLFVGAPPVGALLIDPVNTGHPQGVPLQKIIKLLKRTKERKPQLGKNKSDRISNNLGIFEIDKKVAGQIQNLGNIKILLIDDICTTGATLESAAIEIKKYLPEVSISTLVFARG